jgi:LacI family transcriptional regulator
MALTLEQIARLAGVSLTTASRVINEQPNVRPEVRERVWQVIHEQGYQPNLAARSLALKRSDDDGAESAQSADQTSEVAAATAS